MIRRAYKYRIYPNTEQKEYFAKCFGCVRFFYNKSLADMIEIYRASDRFKNITPAIYKKDYPFLKEVDSFVLCNTQLHRNAAFKAFFREKSRFPKFKTKRSGQSFTTTNHNNRIRFSDDNRYITIAKCSQIKVIKHRDFEGVIKSATISKTCDDKYYISLLVETEVKLLETTNKAIGLDLGVKDLIVDSNGCAYKNNKYLSRLEKKLTREQRKHSHMIKGSNNRNKQKIKIGKIYTRIYNQRNDYLHKISKRIVNENQVICVESISVMRMNENNKRFNKSIYDACMHKLLSMIIYKASWYGRTLVKVPSNFPSSQLCSSCGRKSAITKNLLIRKWTCPECGCVHDRDYNAANNILRKGIEILAKDGVHPDSLFMLNPLGLSSKK